jgi:formylmethanofuran dehydrogenase subunit D
MPGIKVKLITGRLIEQGIHLEDKLGEEYRKAVAICELCRSDLRKLGIEEGKNVEVRTAYGRIVVSARVSDGNPPGIAFIPLGPWANSVIGSDTGGFGIPQFKGIEAEIFPTMEKVKSLKELLG